MYVSHMLLRHKQISLSKLWARYVHVMNDQYFNDMTETYYFENDAHYL
jgi:hypothetical protein